MAPPEQGDGPAPLAEGSGPSEAAAAAKPPLSTDEATDPRRQEQGSRAALADLGRAVTGGSGEPGGRLRAAAEQAAALVAAGEVDRASAVTALWLAAQAAGIGGGRALAAIATTFTRAERSS